jgi:hypothetical protein
VELTEFAGPKGILFCDAQDFLADRGREGLLDVTDEIDLQAWRCAGNFD